jgi:hypothetical protein
MGAAGGESRCLWRCESWATFYTYKVRAFARRRATLVVSRTTCSVEALNCRAASPYSSSLQDKHCVVARNCAATASGKRWPSI